MTYTYASDQEYCDEQGGRCPVCRSSEITAGKADFEGNMVFSDVTCECGAQWVDHYRLIGYDELVDPKDLQGAS